MKALIPLFLPLLVFNLQAVAQDKLTDKDGPGHKYKREEFVLSPPLHPLSFPFSIDSVELRDLRQDTTKFGYYRPGNLAAPIMQCCFKKSAFTQLSSFLNQAYDRRHAPTGRKLLYCIKKLWVVNADTMSMNLRSAGSTRTKLYLKAELYYQQDSCFYPLYRCDSIFIYYITTCNLSGKWIEEILLKSLEPLKHLSPETVLRRPCVKQSDMDGYYADEKRSAIDDGASPRKGVYLNVQQFRNNQPTYSEYEISFDKLSDVMLVKENDGNFVPITKDWGFCDGKQFYIRLGPNYFRLFKMGDTFEFYGTSRVDMGRNFVAAPAYSSAGPGVSLLTAALTSALFSTNPHLDKLNPLQLDMETGKVY